MSQCDYCNTPIEHGYMGYDFYKLCGECLYNLYTVEEIQEGIEEGSIITAIFNEED